MFVEVPVSKEHLSRRRLIFGKGINDADYKTQNKINEKYYSCPFYQRWKTMLLRCYSSKFHKRFPTYIGCTTSIEWLLFSSFKSWMTKQDWQGKHLDKDIVISGNKIYSKETCIFTSNFINNLLTSDKPFKGKYPQGVSSFPRDNNFRAYCVVNNKQMHLGYFGTPEEASKAYKEFKSSHIYKVALEQDEPLKGYLVRIAGEIEG